MTAFSVFAPPPAFRANAEGTLYDPAHERDSCGVGFVADTSGARSHRILATALECVTNLTHRGAVSADMRTGDGAGLSTQIPYRLFRGVLSRKGTRMEDDDDLAVGMVFLPREDKTARERARTITDEALRHHGLACLLWRTVPVDASVLGELGARTRPWIEQVLVGRPDGLSALNYTRRLYLARKEMERRATDERIEGFYLPSLSNRTLVYKGLLVAHQLPTFYRDLRDPSYETALAVFHQRYSTNTFPNWVLSQPFRMLAHNGEINTLAGNTNWTRAREAELRSDAWDDRIDALKPLIQAGGSDSSALDNVLEAVVLSGRDIRHAFMMLIPEAWENMPNMPVERRAFYEYHACLSEPWDGPASMAFTDGVFVGATLDRNGLRPARYQLTADGMIVMGSEAGMVELEPETVVEKGRLGPGQMIGVDTARGELLYNDDIKSAIAAAQPYRAWVKRQLLHLDSWLETRPADDVPADPIDVARQQGVFGYTAEELEFVLKPMAAEGKEPTGSMGDDTALAVFSARPRLSYAYFKQKFAQVTNPPIDPIREELVMSLDSYLGRRRSVLEDGEQHARLVHLASPLMIDEEMEALRRIAEPAFHAITIPALFEVSDGPQGLAAALDRLCEQASMAVDDGATILIVSDRGVTAGRAPVPMLLAVGAVHHQLIREGKRLKASIIAETGEARDVHQIALLIGFGASAVNPYLAFATLRGLVDEGHASAKDVLKAISQEKAAENYEKAVDAGLLKIISKMGISTISGYHAAQIFEAIGLDQETLDRCFEGLTSRIGGIGIDQLAAEVLDRHAVAFGNGKAPGLDAGAYYRYRREGEYHAFNPEVWRALHKAVESGDHGDYRQYADSVQSRPPVTPRDLLEFVPVEPVPLEEVEPIEAIARRFVSAAMSLGALSPEAHSTISIGMNRLGAKSNTGEGGEDAARRVVQLNGDTANSKIKQVASARFGVTPGYLASAEELEIKMAQGSKPGEGGQLPGFKVSAQIAALRHTLPGTPLISPPPHHDIYSIEDLAQLIYDLKMVNPRARVAVKLVAEEGVGTIAAGVAKGYADVVHISGHDGGTGASPLSSIKSAGAPFELGLSETQQVLVMNDLRGRVKLRTDGGFKTGRDVVIAALLGAEEFGFGTAAAVSVGCKMARQCHLNTCPVGVATQREDLRAKFTGTPENVVNFFLHVAEEVREVLASLGARSIDEVIGRVDLLRQVHAGEDPRVHRIDLGRILAQPDPDCSRPHRRMQERNDRVDTPLDDVILRDLGAALETGEPVRLSYAVTNQNRTVGARVSGEIAYRYGDEGLPPNTVQLEFRGSAGQSFGAFNFRGVQLVLTGEANDYVAKGMGGGEVVVRPSDNVPFQSHENTIVGNTVLYGATGGKLFVAGRAGERFAVRNSGALAVIEGVGDHGCEYMTEGVVVILGETGRNFGAGMSNGVAYVLDESREFPKKINPELVGLAQVTAAADIEIMETLIRRHHELTGSRRAKTILDNWESYLPLFWKAAPHFALTEDGPMTIVNRHLRSLKEGSH
jgi:glutamate synthase (NADPH/NADH) large chain/glutamate synthase (ferredoxin)